jgi:hypothetical protein
MRRLMVFATLVAAACGPSQSGPIPVLGSYDHLAGRWRGSFENPAANRAGSIGFTLRAGEQQAYGDVVMIPSGHTRGFHPAHGPEVQESEAQAMVLTIDFVRAAGDSIVGTLAPYHDPECNCTAHTSFVGYVTGNTIRGTFTTRRNFGSISGTWSVEKR